MPLAQERDELKTGNERFARVVHVLEVENQQLKEALAAQQNSNARILHRTTQ
jgi:hypothetical protein